MCTAFSRKFMANIKKRPYNVSVTEDYKGSSRRSAAVHPKTEKCK